MDADSQKVAWTGRITRQMGG